MKRHKISKLKIGEVSAVDRPAQKGARAVLIKRDISKDANFDITIEKGMFKDALREIATSRNMYRTKDNGPKGFLLSIEKLSDTNYALNDALQAVHKFKSLEKKSEIKKIAEEYAKSFDEAYKKVAATILKREGSDMDNAEMSGSVIEIIKKGLGEKSEVDAEALGNAVMLAIKPAIDNAENIAKIVAMPEQHREYLNLIEKSASHSAEERAELRNAFIGVEDVAKRDVIVKQWNSQDDAFTCADGTVIRKSESGTSYAAMVVLAKRNDEIAVDLKKMQDEKANSDRIEKSKQMYPSLVGEDTTRVALEAALEAMPEESAEAVRGVLKAASATNSELFKSIGSPGGGDGGNSADKLDAMTKSRIQKSDADISYMEAYQQVLETPEGEALYEQHTQEMKSN